MFLHLNQPQMGLEDELMRKWGRLGNEISFAGTSTIYKHFKGRLSRKRIEEVLSTIPTYSKYKEKKKTNCSQSYFCILQTSNLGNQFDVHAEMEKLQRWDTVYSHGSRVLFKKNIFSSDEK